MPKRILLIGLLFCLSGVFALCDILGGLIGGRISLNFGIFCFPVGIGLLRGRYSSMMWARFWCLFALAVCVALSIFTVVDSSKIRFSWIDGAITGPAAVPYALTFAICFFAVTFLIYRLLRSPKAVAYCSHGA